MTKNYVTPRHLRESTLRGIGYTPDAKPSPVLFFLGLVIGVCVGVVI